MLQEERLLKLIEYLRANERGSFKELAEMLEVSEVTVRKDLAELERRKAAKLVRGGAVWKEANNTRNIYEVRVTANTEKKEEIAGIADRVLAEGQTVVMGSGSTTVEIAKYIAANYKRLTVITNDLDIVKIFSHKERFNIIVTGGLYDAGEHALYGEQCEEEIGQYNADVCLLAVNSISFEKA